MYNLEITRFIDAAHKLPDSESLTTKKCTNLHGHTYCIKVFIQKDDEKSSGLRDGMVIDFGQVKDIIDELDHKFINDVFNEDKEDKIESFYDTPTTAENIAMYIHRAILSAILLDKRVWAIKVSVCEGYKGPENSNWVHYE